MEPARELVCWGVIADALALIRKALAHLGKVLL
jgi:hypothetical protein